MANAAMQMKRDYLKAIFDDGDLVCPSDTAFDVETYAIEQVSDADAAFEFVCINPFKANTTRRDENVLTFRNILVEMDGISLTEQTELIESKFSMPFTTKVFSGGKSFHYVISLEDPIKTLEHYRQVAQLLMDVLEVADKKCKNPSRFTRMAGANREDKGGVLQELIQVRDRVQLKSLMEFITRNRTDTAKATAARTSVLEKVQVVSPAVLKEGDKGRLSLRTKNYLKLGSTPGNRNNDLFFAACDYKNNLFTIDEARAALFDVAIRSGMSKWEINQAIQSAYKTAGVRPRVV